MKLALIIGTGGFIGSVLRYLVSYILIERASLAFPYGTFTVNLLGCFVIGILLAYAHAPGMTGNWRFFLSTGICGGFTTFSAFSAETFSLIQHGHTGLALLYVTLSVIGGIAAAACGYLIFR